MDEWKLEPAHDLELQGMDRYRSHRREGGLVGSIVRLGWWAFLRTTFRVWNRLQVIGREHLPAQGPFVLIANHASHLDALILTAALPLRRRDQTFPIAARDVFFERRSVAAFSAMVINAMPVFRRATGRYDLAELRKRMCSESCIYILFPEGTRTRNGTMNHFKAGIGILVAGTSIPVVPGHIDGSFRAMPPNRWFLRPTRLTIRISPPQVFANISDARDGWRTCADQLEQEVLRLAGEAELGL